MKSWKSDDNQTKVKDAIGVPSYIIINEVKGHVELCELPNLSKFRLVFHYSGLLEKLQVCPMTNKLGSKVHMLMMSKVMLSYFYVSYHDI